MQLVPFDLIADLLADPANGWSVGSFGAIGEFVRDPDEQATIRRKATSMEIATARGAIRVTDWPGVKGVAWDNLSSDGETWGHALAFCVERPATFDAVIREVGPDANAIRDEDKGASLFDMGVGAGCIRFCSRTRDPGLIDAFRAAAGLPLLSQMSLMGEVLRAQPHRVVLSPAARVEVFQPIPPADGKSPIGPHTHLLPKLVVKDRPHSSNVPIPDGWQSAVSMHPKSPWRTTLGERHPYNPIADASFTPLLDQFGLDDDKTVAANIIEAFDSAPEFCDWPEGRRSRHKARVTLRRFAAAGDPRVKPWRAIYDRAPVEIDADEDR
jgi:hypothetical protein